MCIVPIPQAHPYDVSEVLNEIKTATSRRKWQSLTELATNIFDRISRSSSSRTLLVFPHLCGMLSSCALRLLQLTQMQIHKYKYINTNTHIQIRLLQSTQKIFPSWALHILQSFWGCSSVPIKTDQVCNNLRLLVVFSGKVGRMDWVKLCAF